MEADERYYKGMINVLADQLARYTGTTVPTEIAKAERIVNADHPIAAAPGETKP